MRNIFKQLQCFPRCLILDRITLQCHLLSELAQEESFNISSKFYLPCNFLWDVFLHQSPERSPIAFNQGLGIYFIVWGGKALYFASYHK